MTSFDYEITGWLIKHFNNSKKKYFAFNWVVFWNGQTLRISFYTKKKEVTFNLCLFKSDNVVLNLPWSCLICPIKFFMTLCLFSHFHFILLTNVFIWITCDKLAGSFCSNSQGNQFLILSFFKIVRIVWAIKDLFKTTSHLFSDILIVLFYYLILPLSPKYFHVQPICIIDWLILWTEATISRVEIHTYIFK